MRFLFLFIGFVFITFFVSLPDSYLYLANIPQLLKRYSFLSLVGICTDLFHCNKDYYNLNSIYFILFIHIVEKSVWNTEDNPSVPEQISLPFLLTYNIRYKKIITTLSNQSKLHDFKENIL